MATRYIPRERPEIRAHKDWIGYVQPEGLVVSIPALERAQAWINSNATREQQALVDLLGDSPHLTDFAAFTRDVLGWEPTDLVTPAPQDSCETVLKEYGETLRPDFVVPAPPSPAAAPPPKPQILVSVVPTALDLDRPRTDTPWPASPQARLERLLRDTGVPIGVLTNGTHVRLVYAPSGESSGHATFPVASMCEPQGRPMLAALVMLLGAERLFALEESRRLPAILRDSRRFQNEVSTRLSEQVLAALHELLRGFEAADRATQGQLLAEVLRADPAHLYGGLLTTLLRLVFILYAEDRGLMPSDPTYAQSYSVGGLFEKLDEDASRHPDTMDQRYGAWARLLVLFRLIHDGGRHGALALPPRYGRLFDPDAYPFLEGRPYASCRQTGERLAVPRVSDGVVHSILKNLLFLDTDRLSYRTLDVEQIGSVYEAMMGFAVEVVSEPSIAVRPHHVTVGLESLLAAKPAERLKRLDETAGAKPSGKAADAIKSATTLDELVVALGKSISPRTPHVLPAGSLILQPTEERRRSGSHYTPRVLTEPIVATTLRPILDSLTTLPDSTHSIPVEGGGPSPPHPAVAKDRDPPTHPILDAVTTPRDSTHPTVDAVTTPPDPTRSIVDAVTTPPDSPHPTVDALTTPPDSTHSIPVEGGGPSPPQIPTPDQILALQICDPAMGSGAFLVAACRALGDALLASWQHHGLPPLPPDEDPRLHARRLVAQRCLYGVDKNPFAVDLAKLSLWLVTLAKGHPFTFLDHALRQGDSLVGLTRDQIAAFDWQTGSRTQLRTIKATIDTALKEAETQRAAIHQLADSDDTRQKERLLRDADDAVSTVRKLGNLVLDAFFSESKDKARRARLAETADGIERSGLDRLPASPEADRRTPFHWEIEFPEVFSRPNPGFDAFVGNPPFLGGKRISTTYGDEYRDWLAAHHEESSSNADLVAHFFRRAFNHLRQGGTLGLIATNTIAQGDTRASGLRWICKHGGLIYDATRRYKWPGLAAVIVSLVHIARESKQQLVPLLDGKPVERISAFLFHQGEDDDPSMLASNHDIAFIGVYLRGMGFTFDDTNDDASPLSLISQLVSASPRNSERIFPYLGGDEVNSNPQHKHHRFVISFDQMTETAAREWPDLFDVLEQKVKGYRMTLGPEAQRYPWWLFWRPRPELFARTRALRTVFVLSRVAEHFAVARVHSKAVMSDRLVVFADERSAFGTVLQSRPHELWTSFMATSHEDRGGYQPERCFQTFPFPPDWETNAKLEEIGQRYYEFRAALMVKNDQGLTATYNRFHDPDEHSPEIGQLRALHDEMDRAVLDAYGWTDIQPTCQFLLDYEEEEDESPTPTRRAKKKPWRYRWPDPTRDEILARLLALNATRAAEEARNALPTIAKRKPTQPKPKRGGPSKGSPPDSGPMFS